MQIACPAEWKSQEIKNWAFFRFLLPFEILAVYIVNKEKTKFPGSKFFGITIALLDRKI